MSFYCRLCEQTFEELPENHVAIGSKHGQYQLYRFGKTVHDLRRITIRSYTEKYHLRFHRKHSKPDCSFCQQSELLSAAVAVLQTPQQL